MGTGKSIKFTFINQPCDIGIKGRHLWVQFLISADECVFVDFPDLAVVIPRGQVILQICRIELHPGIYLRLYFLYFFVSSDYKMNGL